MKDWKSTAAGILTFLIATFTTVTAFLAPYIPAAPAGTQALLAKISAGCTLGTALALVYVKIITNNADATAVALALAAAAAQPKSAAATPSAATLSTTPAAATPAAPTAKIVTLLCVLAVGCLTLSGCTNFERDAFNSLAASKAAIDQAQADYVAKTLPETACSYALINDAKAAQTVAVNAMLVYETEKAAKANLDAQVQAVTVDLAAIVPLVAEVNTLYTNPSGCKA